MNTETLGKPNSAGWWWCRCKDSNLSDDWICVDVSMTTPDHEPVIHFGRDNDFIRSANENPFDGPSEWFSDMDWIKATPPQTEGRQDD